VENFSFHEKENCKPTQYSFCVYDSEHEKFRILANHQSSVIGMTSLGIFTFRVF